MKINAKDQETEITLILTLMEAKALYNLLKEQPKEMISFKKAAKKLIKSTRNIRTSVNIDQGK